jgi:hypothetical protein
MRRFLIALIALSVVVAAVPFASAQQGNASKQLKDCAKRGGTC